MSGSGTQATSSTSMSASDSSPPTRAHQVVPHGLVDAPAVGDEPEVDGAELGEDLAGDAGLLLDLAHGGLLGGLAGLDVALGQRPQQPALPVGAADQRAARDVAGEVDDQPAGAELVDLAQPALRRPAPLPPLRPRCEPLDEPRRSPGRRGSGLWDMARW